jgi:hypothetical protein
MENGTRNPDEAEYMEHIGKNEKIITRKIERAAALKSDPQYDIEYIEPLELLTIRLPNGKRRHYSDAFPYGHKVRATFLAILWSGWDFTRIDRLARSLGMEGAHARFHIAQHITKTRAIFGERGRRRRHHLLVTRRYPYSVRLGNNTSWRVVEKLASAGVGDDEVYKALKSPAANRLLPGSSGGPPGEDKSMGRR